MFFFLYNLYLLNMNGIGMTTDGTIQQRKQSQVWRSLWKSEKRVKIGCSHTRLLSLNQFRIGETESRHLVSTMKKRKQGDEKWLRVLAGAFATRINVIIVTTSGHRIDHYNPPENIPHLKDTCLIYLDLEHTRHYLSTTKILNTAPRIPPSTTGSANGNTARIRWVTGSTEPINDPTLAGSSSRIHDSVPSAQTPSISQGTLQDPQPILEDIFANIQYVQGDFVHRLIQNGDLNFIQQTYKTVTQWKPRDCRIQRTSPNEESYKEFIKCLTLILTVGKTFPVKTLERDLLPFLEK